MVTAATAATAGRGCPSRDWCALTADLVRPADKVGTPEAVTATAGQDEMSERKSNGAFAGRRNATSSSDAALLRAATADPGTPARKAFTIRRSIRTPAASASSP